MVDPHTVDYNCGGDSLRLKTENTMVMKKIFGRIDWFSWLIDYHDWSWQSPIVDHDWLIIMINNRANSHVFFGALENLTDSPCGDFHIQIATSYISYGKHWGTRLLTLLMP